MTSAPLVRIRLDDVGRIYQPGDTLSGDCRLQGAAGEEIRAVELSVLWHTEGKGEEDFAVHYFRRLAAEDDPRTDLAGPHRFSTVLPNSPLSYRGLIVKVHWCVRARFFLGRGQEAVAEVSFRLGQVHRAGAISP
jgi:hypothetical protein